MGGKPRPQWPRANSTLVEWCDRLEDRIASLELELRGISENPFPQPSGKVAYCRRCGWMSEIPGFHDCVESQTWRDGIAASQVAHATRAGKGVVGRLR